MVSIFLNVMPECGITRRILTEISQAYPRGLGAPGSPIGGPVLYRANRIKRLLYH